MGDSDPQSDLITAAKHFNDAVAATAVVGSLNTKLDSIDVRTTRIEGKVDILVARDNQQQGERHAATIFISFIVSLATLGTGLAGWLTFFAQH